MVGRQFPILSVIVPFYLIFIMAGFKKIVEVLPAILVSGLSFAVTQYVSANYYRTRTSRYFFIIGFVNCISNILEILEAKKHFQILSRS